MFIRLKDTAGNNVDVNASHIRTFSARGDDGTVLVFQDGSSLYVKDSPMAVRGRAKKAYAGAVAQAAEAE